MRPPKDSSVSNVVSLHEWFKQKKDQERTNRIIQQMKDISAERTLHTPTVRELTLLIKESSTDE